MQRIILMLFMAVLAFSCGGEANSNTQEEASTTQEATPREEASSSSDPAPPVNEVLNPNLASVEELSALASVDESLAKQLIDGRPYLNMKDFHELLAGSLEESAVNALLANCFVPLNLNTASEEEFKMVPGVGDKMAHEFEEYRPYKKIAQFRREMGKYVDDAEIERYEKYVFVPVALNTATDEEILAIPGVGDRMLHEFKEYRPYKSMEQFRREIGKYVDDKELARLERFVYVD
jgi:DNA uptake protein ComE-like DNA-binding protein